MDSYLTSQLIAYIGNKRALLPFLRDVFKDIEEKSGNSFHIGKFLDPFAGSGAVSRLAKSMGYTVWTNDWEPYSFIVNFSHVEQDRRELDALFCDEGGIENVIDYLNNLEPVSYENGYISRYYAPRVTDSADYRKERLFYTAENAVIIDTIREGIERLYPGMPFHDNGDIAKYRSSLLMKEFGKKLILLSSLIYQCATHTNTSGVFKAYHRGFGGYGKDALKRIMGRIKLEIPLLIDSHGEKCKASMLDAKEFVKGKKADLCYLDPPYNQHQYGSNYHMLNTIALWDKPEASLEKGADGKLKNKAGIRRDWVKTRSAYCYRNKATLEFKNLLDGIESRFIAVSYNTEGVIPLEFMIDMLEERGRVEIYTSSYTKYRGGKQSIEREINNMEFVLLVDRNNKGLADRLAIKKKLSQKRLFLLLKDSFYPEKITNTFNTGKNILILEDSKGRIELPMPFFYRFSDNAFDYLEGELEKRSLEEMEEFIGKLEKSKCTSRRDEIGIILKILESNEFHSNIFQLKRFQQRILWLLKKFAFKKYRDVFTETIKIVEDFVLQKPDGFEIMREGVRKVKMIAELRFHG